MPAKNVTVSATFEEEGPTYTDNKYLIGSADEPYNFKNGASDGWTANGNNNTTYVTDGGDDHPTYANLKHTYGSKKSFYYIKSFEQQSTVGAAEMKFDYMPVDGDLSLELTNDTGAAWDTDFSFAKLSASGIKCGGTQITSSLSTSAWTTIDVILDFDLGTATFTVGDAKPVTAVLPAHGEGKYFQTNNIVTPAQYQVVRFVHGDSNSAEAKLTNVTYKTLTRTSELENRTLTVENADPELGKAYIGSEGTLTNSVAQSSTVTATAQANAGARFIKWTSSDSDIGTEATITRRMYADETIKAHFAKIYNINVNEYKDSLNGDATMGTITVDQSKTNAIEGEEVKITVAAAPGYIYTPSSLKVTYNGDQEVTLEPQSTEEAGTFTFNMPAYDVTVTAEFTKNAKESATLKVLYSKDGTDTPEQVVKTVEVYNAASDKHEDDEVSIDSYKTDIAVQDGETKMYKAYTYDSTPTDVTTLVKGENKAIIKVNEDPKSYYYWNNFENGETFGDMVDWATKKPTGYSYAQIGRGGTITNEDGTLHFTPTVQDGSNTRANAAYGIFNSTKLALSGTGETGKYTVSFDVTIKSEHYVQDVALELIDASKNVILGLDLKHTRHDSSTGTNTLSYYTGGICGFQKIESTVSSSTNAEGNIGEAAKNNIENDSKTTFDGTYSVTLVVDNTKDSENGTLTIQKKDADSAAVDAAAVTVAKGVISDIYMTGANAGGTLAGIISIDNLKISNDAAE